MGKPALVIRRDDFDLAPCSPEKWRFMLADRNDCEKDFSLLQIIPYIVLYDPVHDKVFNYVRGTGGGENKLFDKKSIGLGGHVDTLPGNNHIVTHLTEEAIRELREEIGVFDLNAESHEKFTNAVALGMTKTFVLSTSNPVDLVHLCVPVCVIVNSDEIEKHIVEEACVIDQPAFSFRKDLIREGLGKFEFWSAHILERFFEYLPMTSSR